MEKKILVIKPPYDTFPIGFAYVLSCLENHKIPFDFIDTEFGYSYKNNLKKKKYFAVASGGLIGQFNFFREIAQQLKKVRPKLPFIIGGNITKDIRPDFLLDRIGADFGIVGEAETSLPYLLSCLIKKTENFSSVPGLIFKDPIDGKIKRNPEQRLDLSVNIFPAWQHIDVDYYSKVSSWPGHRSTMPVLSGRGCVGRCSFCSPSIGSFRMRPIEHVIEEIEWINSKYDFEWIIFINEMFYMSKEQIKRFCNVYKDLSIRKQWICCLRVDADADVETFLLMKSAGCVIVSAGIESGSDKILQSMIKNTTTEQVKKFFREAETAGLSCSGTFLVGNEGETKEDLKQTIDMLISEEMNANESLTNAYPGTLIYKNALKRGLISDEWEYLEKLKFGCYLWDYEWVNRRHLNISGISDQRVWDVIVKELRRFNTFLLNRFKAKGVSYKLPFGFLIRATGICPGCGGSVSVVSRRSLLGLKAFCPDCFKPVIFDLYELNEFKGHFEFLCRAVQESERLVISGDMKEAVSMLRYDYFGLDCDKIIGFVGLNNQKVNSSDFIYKPKFKIIDLPDIKPDTILITDDYIQDAELLIRRFYLKKDLPTPRIIQLWPDSKRWNKGAFHLVSEYKATGIINKIIFSLFIELILFYPRIKKLFFKFLWSAYPKLLRSKQLNWVRSKLVKWK
ncbi:MAG: radical SAM protein [Candidatus Omnitrophica bacterium]|nr:radical SAM protein [Candidatus Omnitrophota bacterium]